jgi:hypothetical protein
MPTYMLCYSSAYKHLKEPFRRLMEALGYESVTVFDHPEFGSVSDTALERIEKSNGFVVLLGPSKKPEEGQTAFDLATWPSDEAKIALSHRKPVALVVHEGCELLGFRAADQAAARFDFWKPESFLENIHHIVKHLRDLKKRVNNIGEGPEQPYFYRKAVLRLQIQSDGSLIVRINHEAVVQDPRSSFAHELDSGGDFTPEATDRCANKVKLSGRRIEGWKPRTSSLSTGVSGGGRGRCS